MIPPGTGRASRGILIAADRTVGPVKDIVTQPEYLDVTVPAQSTFRHPVRAGHTVFAYGVRFLLVSGKPIGEPVAWHGPIVMNTTAELKTAFAEYEEGTFLKHGHPVHHN
jgi:hypothetical protein